MTKKGMRATVTVTRHQAVLFAGKMLGHVGVSPDGAQLVVNRKRERGSRFDNFYYPMACVVAYCEGDGGKGSAGRREPAYALVSTQAVLRTLTGAVTWDGEWVTVVDDANVTHRVRVDCRDAVTTVFEETERTTETGVFAADAEDRDAPDADYVDKSRRPVADEDLEPEPEREAARNRERTSREEPRRSRRNKVTVAKTAAKTPAGDDWDTPRRGATAPVAKRGSRPNRRARAAKRKRAAKGSF